MFFIMLKIFFKISYNEQILIYNYKNKTLLWKKMQSCQNTSSLVWSLCGIWARLFLLPLCNSVSSLMAWAPWGQRLPCHSCSSLCEAQKLAHSRGSIGRCYKNEWTNKDSDEEQGQTPKLKKQHEQINEIGKDQLHCLWEDNWAAEPHGH